MSCDRGISSSILMAVRLLPKLFLVIWQVTFTAARFGHENDTRSEGYPVCSFNCLPRNRTQFLEMGETGILWEGEGHSQVPDDSAGTAEDSWTCWTELRTCHACRIEVTWKEEETAAGTESTTSAHPSITAPCMTGSSRLDRLVIYEPAYNISTEVTPSSSSSFSSTADQSPAHPSWTYVSTSSWVVLRAEVTRHASPVRAASHLVITYAVRDARETYHGVDGHQMSLRSPNYPLGYAMIGDSVVYALVHVDRHSLIAIVFDDWMLSASSCIDFCKSVDFTQCSAIERSCGSDDRPVLLTKGVVSLLFTASEEMGDSAQPRPPRLHPVVGFHATVYFRDSSENLLNCRLPLTECGNDSRFRSVDREGIVEFTQAEHQNVSYPRFFDCVWVLSAVQPDRRLEMKILNLSIASDLFTVSVHDGLTSTSPAVATFWGSIETDVASTICGRYETVGPRRRTPGPLKPHRMNTTSLEPDDWASTPMGNATIVVSRSMYVRLRGLFHPEDKFTFLYRLYHRPVTVHNADEGSQQMDQTIASQENANRVTSLLPALSTPMHNAGNVVCCSEAVCVDRRFVCRTPSCIGLWSHWPCPGFEENTKDAEVASSSSSSSSFSSTSSSFSSSSVTTANEDGWTIFVPIGFAVCLFWIAVLWFVVRMRKIQLPVRRQRVPCRRGHRVMRSHGSACTESSCSAYCICSEVPVYYSDISRSISTVTTSASFSTVYGVSVPTPPPPSYEEAVKEPASNTGHPILTAAV